MGCDEMGACGHLDDATYGTDKGTSMVPTLSATITRRHSGPHPQPTSELVG